MRKGKRRLFRISWLKKIIFLAILAALAGCQSVEETPTPVALATTEAATNTPAATDTAVPTNTVAPTDLPAPVIELIITDTPPPSPTDTPVPTDTPLPTDTPIPTDTPAPTNTSLPAVPPPPTNTPLPPSPELPPPTATTGAPPPSAPNLLPNPSFENGYTNLYNAPELQVPVGWQMEIDEGGIQAPETGLVFIRPESRIAPRWGLPPAEQGLFLWNGDWTLKVFKGGAPVSFRMFTDVYLEPGTYRFVANSFPDIVQNYNPDGSKVWAPQELAAEDHFIRSGVPTVWTPMTIGVKNTMIQTFTITTAGTVRLGVGWRTRYTQANSGFFIDDWSLQKID